MRQFNYYGQINEEEHENREEDVEQLEREIEEVFRNRVSTADGSGAKRGDRIVNISSAPGGKRNLMSAAYKRGGAQETTLHE